jgi:hypothetical protein
MREGCCDEVDIEVSTEMVEDGETIWEARWSVL